MNKPLFLLSCAGICGGFMLFSSCDAPPQVCAPDRVLSSTDKSTLLVSDRKNKELFRLEKNLRTVRQRQCFPSPVTDMVTDGGKNIWVTCEGPQGMLYQLSEAKLFIQKQYPCGHSPSSVTVNPKTGNFWITQRYLNEVWEFDPTQGVVVSRTPVSREPVDSVSFRDGEALLVIHNLPAQSSLDFPLAAEVDILETKAGQTPTVSKKILLPNGSTDVKAVCTDSEKKFAYIPHLIARYQLPTNQVERGWMSTNALSIIDLQSGEYVNTVLLDTPQKGAANPWDVKITEDGKCLVVSLSGVDELAVINLPDLHERLALVKNGQKGSPSSKSFEDIPNDAGFLHGIRSFVPTGGKGPRGVEIIGDKIFTVNYFSGEIVSCELNGTLAQKGALGVPLHSSPEGKGEMYFHDATIGFQGWQSCASCHPNDARIDGMNWDLLNDGGGTPKNTKSLLLSHRTPPCMATGIRKDAPTAVKSGIKHILFAYSDEATAQYMDDYLISLTPIPSPWLVNGKLSESAQKGKKHFDAHCVSCHSGSLYTDGKQYPVEWTTGKNEKVAMDVPTLKEIWRTAPFLYDGRAKNMEEMLKIHGPQVKLTPEEMKELEQFVLSL